MLHIAGNTIVRQGIPLQQRQDQLRETIRDWLKTIMAKHNVSQRQLALRSNISPSTVNRALDEDGTFVMTTSIMAKITAAFGEPAPTGAEPGAPTRAPGFSESDVTPIDGAPTETGRPATNHYRGRITTEALNLEGFRPGDIVDFDMGAAPAPGDIVVAQIYNMQRGTADTVIRLYQPPFLVTRSTDPRVDMRPQMIDGERVVIMGTFVRLLRERAS